MTIGELRRGLMLLDLTAKDLRPFLLQGDLEGFREFIARRRRRVARHHHPDHGGDADAMAVVNTTADWLEHAPAVQLRALLGFSAGVLDEAEIARARRHAADAAAHLRRNGETVGRTFEQTFGSGAFFDALRDALHGLRRGQTTRNRVDTETETWTKEPKK